MHRELTDGAVVIVLLTEKNPTNVALRIGLLPLFFNAIVFLTFKSKKLINMQTTVPSKKPINVQATTKKTLKRGESEKQENI